jgi:hypothetical protein
VKRYIPGRSDKPPVKKWKSWHAPTIKNVCKLRFRMERLEAECGKVRRIFSNAPELAALYAEMKGPIPGFFAPRPPTGKPSLVVDNTCKPVRPGSVTSTAA